MLQLTFSKKCKKINLIHFRVTLEISCQMDFTTYPFDNHTCVFQVGSCK